MRVEFSKQTVIEPGMEAAGDGTDACNGDCRRPQDCGRRPSPATLRLDMDGIRARLEQCLSLLAALVVTVCLAAVSVQGCRASCSSLAGRPSESHCGLFASGSILLPPLISTRSHSGKATRLPCSCFVLHTYHPSCRPRGRHCAASSSGSNGVQLRLHHER